MKYCTLIASAFFILFVIIIYVNYLHFFKRPKKSKLGLKTQGLENLAESDQSTTKRTA